MATRMILVVEDEESIALPLAAALEREGYATRVTGRAPDAIALAAELQPDLVLLDVMLPDGSGLDVCRELRRALARADHHAHRARRRDRPRRRPRARAPTTTSSSRSQRARAGGPDPRGAAPHERRGRRRRRRRAASQIGGIRVDAVARRVTLDGDEIELTRKEFDLLAAARCAMPGTVVTRERPDGRGLGHELVRLDQDARRPRLPACARSSATTRPTRATCTRCAASASASPSAGRARRMSLRARLLAAFAYVLLLVHRRARDPTGADDARRVDARSARRPRGRPAASAASASRPARPTARLDALARQARATWAGA